MKKLLCFLLLLCIAGSSFAATRTWRSNAASRDWTVAANWSTAVPTSADNAYLYGSNGSTTGPDITTGQTCVAALIKDASSAGANTAYLTMDGGILSTVQYIMVGADSVVSGANRNGALVMNSGSITIGTDGINGHLSVGFGVSGTVGNDYLYMNGGTISSSNNNLRIAPTAYANAYVYVTGGTMTFGAAGGPGLTMNETNTAGIIALLDFASAGNGKLVLNGDQTGAGTNLMTYLGKPGWITVDGAQAVVGSNLHVDYDVTNPGMTTIYAIPEPATICLLGLGAIGLLRRR